MAWRPIAGSPPQIDASDGTLASGYFLKFYASGTTTPINMATDSTGGTTLAKCQINASGYPINGSSAVFIPYIDQKYRLVLYTNATDADANTFGNADWDLDAIDYAADIRDELANTSNAAQGDALVGALRTAASASATDYHAMLEEEAFYVCRDFGAPNDGTNGETEFQAAIDAVPATGGVVVIDGLIGLNTVGVNITSKTNLKIVALGAKSGIKILGAAVQTMGNFGTVEILFSSSTNCGIENVPIDGNSIAVINVGFSGCTECYAKYNRITNPADHGIAAINNTRNSYIGNVVNTTTSSGRGLWIGNTPSGEVEVEPYIHANKAISCAASGIALVATDAVVTDNICKGTSGSGIAISSNGPAAGNDSSVNVLVSGNLCSGNTFHGIQIDTSGTALTDYAKGVSIMNNVCRNNNQTGIYAAKCQDVVIHGNICIDNDADNNSTSDAGIYAETFVRGSITGNIIYDSASGASRTAHDGIRLIAQGSSSEDISDVIVSGNMAYNLLGTGINITNTAGNTAVRISVIGNQCRSNVSGIAITDVADGDITDVIVDKNICLGNTTDIRTDPSAVMLGDNIASVEHVSTRAGIFTDQDATPSVKYRKVWKTANTVGTTITDFDDGYHGQEIKVIIDDTNTTIDFTASSLKGNVGVDWSPTTGDHMTCVLEATTWYCTVSDNTA